MKLFKPEDFESITIITDKEMQEIAEIANAKLKEWLDAAPTVYGQGIGAMKSAYWNMNGPDFEIYKHTHAAKLVCIEEIKKDCKHEPLEEIKHTVCKHCGVHLDAEWMVK